MSAPAFKDAEDIDRERGSKLGSISNRGVDYLITNVEGEKVTEQWIVETYSPRNWGEVFYREAKGWLGLSEYQVREKKGLERHFILVFCAYTFILWHKLTGGLRRRWANKPLDTFPEAPYGISYSYILSFCPMTVGDAFGKTSISNHGVGSTKIITYSQLIKRV